MTDNEIIKALECCSVHPMKCTKCPYEGTSCCTNAHRKDALDLINRQKAEIERLYKEVDRLSQIVLFHPSQIDDVIKEFAERLKEMKYLSSEWSHGEHPYVVEVDDIENLVKEMTEGNR